MSTQVESIVMNKETVFVDELIRENARLTVQHEADQQKIADLRQMLGEQDAQSVSETRALNEMLGKAIADLHYIMAGGDACKVCTVKCAFGEGHCSPVWRGEEQQA